MAEALVAIMMDIFYVMFGPPEHTNAILYAGFNVFFGFWEAVITLFSWIGGAFG